VITGQLAPLSPGYTPFPNKSSCQFSNPAPNYLSKAIINPLLAQLLLAHGFVELLFVGLPAVVGHHLSAWLDAYHRRNHRKLPANPA
jgi:hypothetical protein